MYCNNNHTASNSDSPPCSPKRKRARMDVNLENESVTMATTTVGGDCSSHEEKRPEDDPHKDVGQQDDYMEGEPVEQQSDIVPGAVEPQLLPPIKYEYLDHTADVQIHAWGDNLAEAFEQCAMGMFAYITDIERIDNFGTEQIEATGHDMLSLLYGFLDEWLFVFNADPYFVARKISITSFDRDNFKISAIGYGETFNLAKHTQGTEVKAITYSNMQFHEKEGYAEVFVIIDI